MKPGRELDALIAEKVMGLKNIRLANDGRSDYLCYGKPDSIFLEGKIVPAYSTDISAAWLVVEKMQDNDWAFILDNMEDFIGNWQAHFEKDKSGWSADSESAPHAICLAALKAIIE